MHSAVVVVVVPVVLLTVVVVVEMVVVVVDATHESQPYGHIESSAGNAPHCAAVTSQSNT